MMSMIDLVNRQLDTIQQEPQINYNCEKQEIKENFGDYALCETCMYDTMLACLKCPVATYDYYDEVRMLLKEANET